MCINIYKYVSIYIYIYIYVGVYMNLYRDPHLMSRLESMHLLGRHIHE